MIRLQLALYVILISLSCSERKVAEPQDIQKHNLNIMYELYFANAVFNNLGTYHKDSLMKIALAQLLQKEGINEQEFELELAKMKESHQDYKMILDSLNKKLEERNFKVQQ